jgi:hypothetical protein
VRNQAQKPGNDRAQLSRVVVNRGLPAAEHDPKPYARNLAQKAEWERDSRVTVTLRPLKYQYQRDLEPAIDEALDQHYAKIETFC